MQKGKNADLFYPLGPLGSKTLQHLVKFGDGWPQILFDLTDGEKYICNSESTTFLCF